MPDNGFVDEKGGVRVIQKDARYIHNYCAKYLARVSSEARHNYVDLNRPDFQASICEPWRFPIIDSFAEKNGKPGTLNQVTFIYFQGTERIPEKVEVFGTFADLQKGLPLRQVSEGSPYFALTVIIPLGQVHTYKYRVDGEWRLDPINPQQERLVTGEVRSRFFTQQCAIPLSFNRWERAILDRLVTHILPFQTDEGRNFLERHGDNLDEVAREGGVRAAYHLDESIGVVNYIDKLVAGQEAHYLGTYHTCLEILQGVLAKRHPNVDIDRIPKSTFVQLYNEMAVPKKDSHVDGWDYSRYEDPQFFLTLLRRHTYTGAFSHPKYHGNIGAAGWAYLYETLRNSTTKQSVFDWSVSQELPFGKDPNYLG